MMTALCWFGFVLFCLALCGGFGLLVWLLGEHVIWLPIIVVGIGFLWVAWGFLTDD